MGFEITMLLTFAVGAWVGWGTRAWVDDKNGR